MKRKVGLALVLSMMMSVMAGCSSGAGNSSTSANVTSQDATSETSKTDGDEVSTENAVADIAWPEKDITIIVPFNAGGDTDFHARNLAGFLSKKLGVNVVVENVAGANGTTGLYQLMDSDPDGYTALFFHDSMLTNFVVGTSEANYTDIAPCAATIVDNSYVMAVNSKSDYKTLDDVFNAAKENPGKLTYASSVGGYSYYLGRKFEEDFDVDFNIVDAGGGTDRNAALLAGTIDTNVNPYGVMKSYFDSNDFTALCNIAEERNPLFPDVPTAKELGYDWVAERNYFLSFPKDTDPAIIGKVEAAIKDICQEPDFIKATEDAYCVSPTFVGTDELIKKLDKEFAEFSENVDLINN